MSGSENRARIGSSWHDSEPSLGLGSKPQDSASRTHLQNGLTRHSKASDGYILTENTYGQLRLAQRLSSSEDEEKIRSRDAIRQKSKEMQQKLQKQKSDYSSKKNTQSISLSQPQASSATSLASASISNGGAKGKERRIKHIILNPEYRLLSGNETSGVEICQKLFGITVFEYSNGKSNHHPTHRDRKLVVQSVVEGSRAFCSGNISRGDMLIRINDVDVSWRNFSQLLKTLNKREKVRLTFQSPKIIGPKSSYTVLQVPEADLCLATLGKRLAHIQEELAHLNCVAMYLTLVQSSSESELDQMEDVVYAFPPGEETLTALRGLFITLSSALLDVVEQPAVRSHLHLNKSRIHVAYRQCGRDVLVFAMPGNRITPSCLEKVLNAFTSLLVLLFGDVQSAFQDCDRVWLDKIMALTFHRALELDTAHRKPDNIQWPSLTSMLTSDPWNIRLLALPNKDRLLCDEILNEFEAMDFDDFLDDVDLFARRKYVIRGTSLYYKGHLITSHLFEEHQRDVNLFLHSHELLSLSSRQEVNQVFVWHELKFNQDAVTSVPVGYRPCVTRNFLMVIGLHHYYLSVLVEAGSSPDQSQNLPARPLPLLVEQGRATLAQLETEEVHMSQCCEESLTSTNRDVVLTCPDQFCVHHSPRSRSGAKETTSNGKVMSPHNRPTLTSTKTSIDAQLLSRSRSKSADRLDDRDVSSHQDASIVIRRYGSKHSYGSNDSGGSGSSGPSKGRGSRISSATDLTSISHSLSVVNIDKGIAPGGRLTRGHDNYLFSYVHLDEGAGVLVAPTDLQLLEQHSYIQAQVLDNFALACHKIKNLLHCSVGNEAGKSVFLSQADEAETNALEAGTLFRCSFQSSQDKRQVSSLQYWVVGRTFSSPRPQLLFVCFHESTDQSMVETAFSLTFGT